MLTPSPARAGTLDALVVTASAADLATTEWALSRPGLAEANPLMREAGPRLAVKVVGTAAVVAGAHALERRGHRGWAKAVRILAIVGWSGAAVNNAVQARRAR